MMKYCKICLLRYTLQLVLGLFFFDICFHSQFAHAQIDGCPGPEGDIAIEFPPQDHGLVSYLTAFNSNDLSLVGVLGYNFAMYDEKRSKCRRFDRVSIPFSLDKGNEEILLDFIVMKIPEKEKLILEISGKEDLYNIHHYNFDMAIIRKNSDNKAKKDDKYIHRKCLLDENTISLNIKIMKYGDEMIFFDEDVSKICINSHFSGMYPPTDLPVAYGYIKTVNLPTGRYKLSIKNLKKTDALNNYIVNIDIKDSY